MVQNIYASLLHLNNFYNSVIIYFILRHFVFIWIAFIMFTGHYTELCSHFLPVLHCRMAEKGENLPNLSNKNYISKQVACLWYLYRQNGWKSVSGNEEPETRSHWGQARYVCHMFRHIYIYIYVGCPTRYQTRHFFNNFTTNEDIATKFEADLPQCVRNVTTS